MHELIPVFRKCCTHPAKCTSLQILQKPITKPMHGMLEYLPTNENTGGQLPGLWCSRYPLWVWEASCRASWRFHPSTEKRWQAPKNFQNSWLEIPAQELERIPPLDQQKLTHRWWENVCGNNNGCWGERFTRVGIGSGLLGTIPWCAIAACNVA